MSALPSTLRIAAQALLPESVRDHDHGRIALGLRLRSGEPAPYRESGHR